MNCGRYSYENGERTEEYVPENDRASLEFACSVWGSIPQEMGFVFDENTQSYHYEETTEEQLPSAT